MPVAFDGKPPSSELDCPRGFSFGSVFGRFIMVGTMVANGVAVKGSTVKLVDMVGDNGVEWFNVLVGYCNTVGVGGEVGLLAGE